LKSMTEPMLKGGLNNPNFLKVFYHGTWN